MPTYDIDREACIRCGVSASVAPELIALTGDGPAAFTRQPVAPEETHMAESARLLCPANAIARVEGPA
jgi:ferredoxin